MMLIKSPMHVLIVIVCIHAFCNTIAVNADTEDSPPNAPSDPSDHSDPLHGPLNKTPEDDLPTATSVSSIGPLNKLRTKRRIKANWVSYISTFYKNTPAALDKLKYPDAVPYTILAIVGFHVVYSHFNYRKTEAFTLIVSTIVCLTGYMPCLYPLLQFRTASIYLVLPLNVAVYLYKATHRYGLEGLSFFWRLIFGDFPSIRAYDSIPGIGMRETRFTVSPCRQKDIWEYTEVLTIIPILLIWMAIVFCVLIQRVPEERRKILEWSKMPNLKKIFAYMGESTARLGCVFLLSLLAASFLLAQKYPVWHGMLHIRGAELKSANRLLIRHEDRSIEFVELHHIEESSSCYFEYLDQKFVYPVKILENFSFVLWTFYEPSQLEGYSGLTNGEVEKNRNYYGPKEINGPKEIKAAPPFIMFDEIRKMYLAVKSYVPCPYIPYILLDVFHGKYSALVDHLQLQIIYLALFAEHCISEGEYPSDDESSSDEPDIVPIAPVLSGDFPAKVKCKRDGKITEINTEKLVCGDLIELEEGMLCPCDVLLLEGRVYVEESFLTGDTRPFYKSALDQSDKPKDAFRLSKEKYSKNILRAGTRVLIAPEGAKSLVIHTIFQTDYGRGNFRLSRPICQQNYPLDMDTKILLGYERCKYVCALASSIYHDFVRKTDTNVLLFSVDFFINAYATYPSALLTNHSRAVSEAVKWAEKYGIKTNNAASLFRVNNIDVCLFSKTGTLTEEKLTFKSFWPPKSDQPESSIENMTPNIREILGASNLVYFKDNIYYGTPVEVAAFKASEFKAEEPDRFVYNESNCRIIKQFPFESQYRRMTVVMELDRDGSLSYVVIMKGAPSEVQKYLSEPISKDIARREVILASEGYKVLAYASKTLLGVTQEDINAMSRDALESGLEFAGFAAFEFELKKGIEKSTREVIQQLVDSERQVVIVTGGFYRTAVHVAIGQGLLNSYEDGTVEKYILVQIKNKVLYFSFGDSLPEPLHSKDQLPSHPICITGDAFEFMRTYLYHSDLLPYISKKLFIAAEFCPDQKYNLVEYFQQRGLNVGMVTSHMNCASAIQAANLGVVITNRKKSETDSWVSNVPVSLLEIAPFVSPGPDIVAIFHVYALSRAAWGLRMSQLKYTISRWIAPIINKHFLPIPAFKRCLSHQFINTAINHLVNKTKTFPCPFYAFPSRYRPATSIFDLEFILHVIALPVTSRFIEWLYYKKCLGPEFTKLIDELAAAESSPTAKKHRKRTKKNSRPSRSEPTKAEKNTKNEPDWSVEAQRQQIENKVVEEEVNDELPTYLERRKALASLVSLFHSMTMYIAMVLAFDDGNPIFSSAFQEHCRLFMFGLLVVLLLFLFAAHLDIPLAYRARILWCACYTSPFAVGALLLISTLTMLYRPRHLQLCSKISVFVCKVLDFFGG